MCFSRFWTDCQNVKKQRLRTKILTCQKLTKFMWWRRSPHPSRNGLTASIFYFTDYQHIHTPRHSFFWVLSSETYMFYHAKDRLSGCKTRSFALRNLIFQSRELYVSQNDRPSEASEPTVFHLGRAKKKMLKHKLRFNIFAAESYIFQIGF